VKDAIPFEFLIVFFEKTEGEISKLEIPRLLLWINDFRFILL